MHMYLCNFDFINERTIFMRIYQKYLNIKHRPRRCVVYRTDKAHTIAECFKKITQTTEHRAYGYVLRCIEASCEALL